MSINQEVDKGIKPRPGHTTQRAGQTRQIRKHGGRDQRAERILPEGDDPKVQSPGIKAMHRDLQGSTTLVRLPAKVMAKQTCSPCRQCHHRSHRGHPWTGYNMPGQQMMMMPQHMAPIMHMQMAPTPVQPPQPPQPVAPMAPSFQSPAPPQLNMDSEQREFMEMARARQAELPADMRQKMQKMTKKEGAQATKDLHSAVRNLGFARKDVEEALQARFNLISSWKSFLSGAVQTWQEYTALFQQQERDLQERIQQAHIAFAAAKAQAEQSQVEAGKITPIEIKDDEEELEGQTQADLSSGKIHEGLQNLTASLQQLQQQAEAIETEQKATKRPRTEGPLPSEAMETSGPEHSGDVSKPPFVSPGCA